MDIFTVGHSNLDFRDFVTILQGAGILTLIDVRKLPGSRKYPWFNDEHLGKALPDHGIAYRRLEGLAGRRNVSTTIPFEVNGNWRNRSFHNYADHALGTEFNEALEELRTFAADAPTAIMCSEAVWWRCHRRIIADHLLARGDRVHHIMGQTKNGTTLIDAVFNQGAVVGDDGLVRYPHH
ncbi:DUF488 domain-containing protein [Corynebacterium pseudotuberculosis]|uniref:DUF488 family protein n=1 Tax=Corynebacterium pseudotuberculosis (strain C231) TaxID=681645 RepID=D9Q9K3_CORP2|nr:DUF488 domain-containing protein [Corynebacterium pseudotuberculosis]ADK28540.1 DUF488 family protein [Corynebacterium pseudotuberculosis FRC41]ADL10229.1 DUF488 family protein [Corynebacterium pseudotuberculosis C231]ADL20638.1 DUF488 domain-containing protein [Corynebacterium pseudotuberculosis 1002]ADO26021.1 DUF488 family protein [Corynebacterium pseudotuberculosis I19]AEK92079.1 Hypothetical protein CpPAT10_0745 [Corynebacterium pseudotuberculosis PAT10]